MQQARSSETILGYFKQGRDYMASTKLASRRAIARSAIVYFDIVPCVRVYMLGPKVKDIFELRPLPWFVWLAGMDHGAPVRLSAQVSKVCEV